MSLARLLQLASPALPVGAYSYSGGLEAAVEAGIVMDAQSAQRWIGDVLELSIATMDARLVFQAISSPARAGELNELYLASRETAELRAETLQMGYSLCRLLRELGMDGVPEGEVAYPVAYAHAARGWSIPAGDAVQAYVWSWLENQVMAAVKAVPLGQTAGQRMLAELGSRIAALDFANDEMTNLAPALAILSSRHETQYSRLFRS